MIPTRRRVTCPTPLRTTKPSEDSTLGTWTLATWVCGCEALLECPHPLSRSSLQCHTTSEHVHSGALQTHGQRLGAGEAAGPTGQVLGRDAEAATGLSNQQVLAGSGEGECQPIKRHIVGGTRCLAPSTAQLACAVPLLALAHTVGKGQGQSH